MQMPIMATVVFIAALWRRPGAASSRPRVAPVSLAQQRTGEISQLPARDSDKQHERRFGHVSDEIGHHLPPCGPKSPAIEDPRKKTMQPTATQAARERAKADHLIEKFRTIGPAAVQAALVCSARQVKQAGTAASETAQAETD
jgi:hypothetical protein